MEHCTANLQYGKCAPCDDGTFRSHPSSEKTCERCKSCNHPNGKKYQVDISAIYLSLFCQKQLKFFPTRSKISNEYVHSIPNNVFHLCKVCVGNID